ncbi:MAG TPA: transposase, partial [Candidatus Competibacter sp.]|nr:transposase [Candidatus Competibacter sp.]
MNEFRRWAAKMDQHMQQLAAQGVNDAPAILHRMMGYAPDLHQIWTGTTDDQLLALSHEFPGFYRYARIMEEAFEA